jgi:hypothetical protein
MDLHAYAQDVQHHQGPENGGKKGGPPPLLGYCGLLALRGSWAMKPPHSRLENDFRVRVLAEYGAFLRGTPHMLQYAKRHFPVSSPGCGCSDAPRGPRVSHTLAKIPHPHAITPNPACTPWKISARSMPSDAGSRQVACSPSETMRSANWRQRRNAKWIGYCGDVTRGKHRRFGLWLSGAAGAIVPRRASWGGTARRLAVGGERMGRHDWSACESPCMGRGARGIPWVAHRVLDPPA